MLRRSLLFKRFGVVLVLGACGDAPRVVPSRGMAGAAALAAQPSLAPCSIQPQYSGVSLMADLPAEIAVARSWIFEACRESDGCWVFDVDPDKPVEADAGLALDLVTPGSYRVRASMSLLNEAGRRPFVSVGWEVPGKPVVPDRTTIKARQSDGTTHDLFDERVFYTNETKVLGRNCSINFYGAVVDKRDGSDADAGS
jgi:hypothetical protein